jgi:hypothetical protein
MKKTLFVLAVVIICVSGVANGKYAAHPVIKSGNDKVKAWAHFAFSDQWFRDERMP